MMIGRAPVVALPSGVVVVTTEWIGANAPDVILGLVVGVAPHSTSPFKEGLRSLFDGHGVDDSVRVRLMMRSRAEAIERMAANARDIGADAVLGMRFDHRQVTDGWAEVCAYGTAVRTVRTVGAVRHR